MNQPSTSQAGASPRLRQYAIAALFVAASVLIRFALAPWLGLKVPYLQFFPAILVAGQYGGPGPSVLATVLSALAAMYFFLPPAGFAIADPADAVSLPLFVLTGLTIGWLYHKVRAAETSQRVAADRGLARAERLDAHDLTSRVRLEEQLRASESRWRSIIDSAVDGIVVIDRHGRVEAFNPAAERLFDYSEAEVLGRNVNMLMPSPYREEHDQYLARYLATGRAQIIGVGRQVDGRRKDGTTFPLHLSVGQFTFAGEQKFTGILHDLTTRVGMEEQLRERASLAQLGEMAAVIAHEVRNPLAGIRGAVQMIGAQLPPDGRNSAMVKEIVTRIDSLNEMMKDLLLFARPPQPRPRKTEVVPLVQMTARLLSQDPALRGVHIDVAGSAPAVSADAEMLKIVFQNLLVNSAHAMGGHGRIRVEVSTGDAACLVAFHDEGPGIPADVREKIFTPFFTTKTRGSGLGLPTAKRLIEAQNGAISIDCPPGGGTTVTVTLPAMAS
jgi:two-component system sensor kinase FixL